MKKEDKSKWTAITVTVIISGLLTCWGIQGIGAYGMALFILTPLFIGVAPVILYGSKQPLTTGQARNIGFLTLAVFTAGLIVFAMEGLICIAMAAPIAIPLTWVGTLIGHSIVVKKPNSGTMMLIILALTIPITAFVEKKDTEDLDLIEVTTSIEIDAKCEDVWEYVVEFPILNAPTEFIFKTGIAYPISAEIKGQGVGAIRYCSFSTGSFVEPITIWDQPQLLRFDVAESPAPMKELSFYDINAPHLHDYFVSQQGQFKLTELEDGKTLLEGTTWYYHNIRPVLYWRFWSEYIIHKIHMRVLSHIKEKSEKCE